MIKSHIVTTDGSENYKWWPNQNYMRDDPISAPTFDEEYWREFIDLTYKYSVPPKNPYFSP